MGGIFGNRLLFSLLFSENFCGGNKKDFKYGCTPGNSVVFDIPLPAHMVVVHVM